MFRTPGLVEGVTGVAVRKSKGFQPRPGFGLLRQLGLARRAATP
jgi:hypothetical protein